MIAMLSLGLLSCKVEPEPLRYGEDACHHCKMTLMDKKFGAELVTKKGKVYKFDDVNCMLQFYNSGKVTPGEFSYKLVVDFSQPETLIEAGNAFYLKSPEIKSPMASQIAAFEKKESMDALKDQWNGIYIVWGELVTQFK
jgi:copper chaperone NosL